MVISGTHALDIVMWCMEAKTPVECYARSIDKALDLSAKRKQPVKLPLEPGEERAAA